MDFDFDRVGSTRRRADRLLRLVQLLRHHRSLTAQQLADRLEISKRTVYRDLDALDASGVRIRSTPGEGYALDRQALLPPLSLEDDESEALVIGLRMAAAWVDPTLGAAAHAALEKIEAVLPPESAAVLSHVRLFAPRGEWARKVRDGLEPVRTAIAHRRKLRFDYHRLDGRRGRRVVRPLGLHFWGEVWTLAAWCEQRGDYRTFRVDRIGDPRALDEGWSTDEGIELEGYLAHKREQAVLSGVEGLGAADPGTPSPVKAVEEATEQP